MIVQNYQFVNHQLALIEYSFELQTLNVIEMDP
jgi:hypothetical protein